MAQRKIKWTPKALKQKLQIQEYWYQRNKSLSYPIKLEKLFNSILNYLAHQPKIGRTFNKKSNISYIIVKDYRIYYSYNNDEIIVITIWDVRRNPLDFKI